MGATAAAGPKATDLKFTLSGYATAASDVVLSYEIWDPNANGGKGAWAGFGAVTTTVKVGQGAITGSLVPSIVFTSGKKFRAIVQLKRGGQTVTSDYSNEVIAP